MLIERVFTCTDAQDKPFITTVFFFFLLLHCTMVAAVISLWVSPAHGKETQVLSREEADGEAT